MTDNRISLRDIVGTLASSSKIGTPEAEEFLRAFTETILEGLNRDTIVKIKGLGTFKLIAVESRESVNVNTGERITIEGHTKVSFTPDSALRDEINKPFSSFQTVILNEGMDLSAIGKEETAEPAPEPEPVPEEPAIEEPKTEEPIIEQPVIETPTVETPIIENPQPEEPQLTTPYRGMKHPEKRRRRDFEYKHHSAPQCHHLLAGLCVLLLCALSYAAGYYRWIYDGAKPYIPEEYAIQQPVLQPEPEPEPENEADEQIDTVIYPQVDFGDYLIVGVKGTHQLARGQSLREVAIKYYGHKDFVPYIIALNEITNPDVVPVGMELKLPELKKIGQ